MPPLVRVGASCCPDASGPVRAEAGIVSGLPVIVYPPSPTGGRRVRVDGEILGLAWSLRDVAEFLRRAGLEDADETLVARSELIEWRGGGPDVGPEPP